MRESTSWYPSLKIDGNGSAVVSQAGAVALLRTAAKVGLDRELPRVLAPWRKPLTTHDPGKVGRLEITLNQLHAAQPDPTAAPNHLQRAITECDRKLARHRAALEAGADPAMVGA